MELLKMIGINVNNVMIIKLIDSSIIIMLLVLIRGAVTWVLMKRIKDPKTRFNTRKSTSYIAIFLGIILVGRVWFSGMSAVTTYLGLLSAGLAIALKDIISNFAGWLFIISRKPFVTGNRIKIGEHSGDVIDIRPFQFTILEIGAWVRADQSTGRMIHIPNGKILTTSITNYDSGFKYIWNELPVLVTFESDWKFAKQILEDIIRTYANETTNEAEQEIIRTARKFFIYYRYLTPRVYTSVEDSGVLLTVRYLTSIRQRRDSAEIIWEQILDRFSAHEQIKLAYPTTRFFSDSVKP